MLHIFIKLILKGVDYMKKMNIEYRKMKRNEISEIVNIDRSDYADMMYQVNNKELILTNNVFNHRGLKNHDYLPYIKDLQDIFDDDGVLYGVFISGILNLCSHKCSTERCNQDSPRR